MTGDINRWLLVFDGSAPRTVVAVGRPEVDALPVAWDEDEDGANQTSARIIPRIEAVLDEAEIDMSRLSAIAVGCGPGTFTGARVAVATAQGLCLGLGVEAVPVSSLAALAASAGTSGRVLALLDARRSEVYGAVFNVGDGTIERETEERCASLDAVLEGLDIEGLIAYGPGTGPYAAMMPEALTARSTLAPGPTAQGLWTAARDAWRKHQHVDPARLGVTYLRASYAEMGIHKPKRPVTRSPFL